MAGSIPKVVRRRVLYAETFRKEEEMRRKFADMKIKRLTLEEFNYIYSKVPRLTLELIVKNGDGIVLTKRDIEPYKGYWHIPGGTLLLRETIKGAIQRIAKEEIGTKVKVEAMIGCIEYLNEEEFKGIGQGIALEFLVTPLSTEFKGSWQGEEVKTWYKLPKHLIKEHRKFLKENNLL